MQPDDVVATSVPRNVSAMGPLPVMVLWRDQVPLLRGGHCGFWRQKNRKKKRDSQCRQANPVCRPCRMMRKDSEEDDGGGERRRKVDATAYMRCTLHLSHVPNHVVTSSLADLGAGQISTNSTSNVAWLPYLYPHYGGSPMPSPSAALRKVSFDRKHACLLPPSHLPG